MTRHLYTADRLPGLTGLRPGDLVEQFGRTRTVAHTVRTVVTFTDGTTASVYPETTRRRHRPQPGARSDHPAAGT